MFITQPEVYRSMITGFHKVFNIKEKIVYDNELMTQLNGDKSGGKTAQELLDNAEQLRNRRLKNTEIKNK